MQVAGNVEHTSLHSYKMNYHRKEFYSTGLCGQHYISYRFWLEPKLSMLNKFLALNEIKIDRLLIAYSGGTKQASFYLW